MVMGSKINRHISFSNIERVDWILSSFVFASIYFLMKWRTTSFILTTGIAHFILILIASLIVLSVLIAGSKILAIKKNYTAEYTRWNAGLIIGFFLSVLTVGFFPALIPGKVEIKRIERLGFGEVFPAENKLDIFYVLSGSLYVLVVAGLFFHLVFLATQIIFFKYLLQITALLLIYSILPFPESMGSHVYYFSRTRNGSKYYFLLGFILFFSIFLFLESILALFLGVIGSLLLSWAVKKYFSLEKKK